jgi:hypothetical protein
MRSDNWLLAGGGVGRMTRYGDSQNKVCMNFRNMNIHCFGFK